MQRLLRLWCTLWLLTAYPVAAENLLAVAPQVERAEKVALEELYSALHHLVTHEAGLYTELRFLPIEQVRALLARREAQMQLGGVCEVKRHVPVYYTLPYVGLARHIVTAEAAPVITSIEDAQGMRLGLIKGYFYQLPDKDALDALGITLIYSKDLRTSVQMLQAQRVDALIANAHVVEHIALNRGFQLKLNYDLEKPFSNRSFCYVLPQSKVSAQLVPRLNDAIIRLHHSGKLAEYMVPPYHAPSAKQLGLIEP